jgi:hypothetical protein
MCYKNYRRYFSHSTFSKVDPSTSPFFFLFFIDTFEAGLYRIKSSSDRIEANCEDLYAKIICNINNMGSLSNNHELILVRYTIGESMDAHIVES